MKQKWLILALSLLMTNASYALIVNLNGHGEIPEEGLEITLTEAEQDPLTGNMRMDLNGNLLSDGALQVTITRSQAGLTDEFCCSDQCTVGNGESSEILNFSTSGVVSWFVHYTPQPNSEVTVTYLFTDSSESRTLTVHYHYDAQAIEAVDEEKTTTRKIIQDGILYIIRDNKKYTIL